ncbi:MAG TPA: hypothetical protein VE569_03685 [Acidimicrobiia bacterium]|nr:hypothetical protein [Acidimicrobiia bacterium]
MTTTKATTVSSRHEPDWTWSRGEGWFTTETRKSFDLLSHFPGVDEWFEFPSFMHFEIPVPEQIKMIARSRLAEHGGELVVRKPTRASLLKRFHGRETGSGRK